MESPQTVKELILLISSKRTSLVLLNVNIILTEITTDRRRTETTAKSEEQLKMG